MHVVLCIKDGDELKNYASSLILPSAPDVGDLLYFSGEKYAVSQRIWEWPDHYPARQEAKVTVILEKEEE